MAGTFGLYREAASTDVITEDDGRKINVNPGDRVFVSFVSAAKDPKHFPNPEEVDPRRPLDKYIHYGVGPHTCLGRDVSHSADGVLPRALQEEEPQESAWSTGRAEESPETERLLRLHD